MPVISCPPQTPASHLKSYSTAYSPKAEITAHPLGCLLQNGQEPRQLVCCVGGIERPFEIAFKLPVWRSFFDAGAKLSAEVSYAVVEPIGASMHVLPLSSMDRHAPGWPTPDVASVFDEDEEEYTYAELVRCDRKLTNKVSLPPHKLSEWQLQAQCVAWLREAHPNLVMFSVPVERAHRKWETHALAGCTAGVADCCILLPDGRTLWVEFKVGRNGLRESQQEFQRKLRPARSPLYGSAVGGRVRRLGWAGGELVAEAGYSHVVGFDINLTFDVKAQQVAFQVSKETVAGGHSFHVVYNIYLPKIECFVITRTLSKK